MGGKVVGEGLGAKSVVNGPDRGERERERERENERANERIFY